MMSHTAEATHSMPIKTRGLAVMIEFDVEVIDTITTVPGYAREPLSWHCNGNESNNRERVFDHRIVSKVKVTVSDHTGNKDVSTQHTHYIFALLLVSTQRSGTEDS